MNRQKSIFRPRPQQVPKPKPTSTVRSPLTEISDVRRLRGAGTSTAESKRRAADYIIPSNNYDENQKEKFEVMNIKIVVYGLTGLVCEEEPKKKQKTIFPAAIGLSRREIKPISSTDAANAENDTESRKKKTLDTTTAVVSCPKNGTGDTASFETFLPSLPLGNPIATSLDKVSYVAAWPLEQSILQQDDLSKDRSVFTVTRCMKQATFIPGMGARSSYCHETIELGINISRGTELIRLGTATIVINGEEEDEVEMNVSTTPFVFNSKKLKKKKNKYGYFSNDTSRRFSLDKNSVLKVGVQVIPQESVRIAREKEKKENELNELLEQDEVKTLLQEMGNTSLGRERSHYKSLVDPTINLIGASPEHEDRRNSYFSGILCGSIPTSWVPSCLKNPETEPDIPTEVIADEGLDQLVIKSLISSMSEASDDSDILEGKKKWIRGGCVFFIYLFFSLKRFVFYRYYWRGVLMQDVSSVCCNKIFAISINSYSAIVADIFSHNTL